MGDLPRSRAQYDLDYYNLTDGRGGMSPFMQREIRRQGRNRSSGVYLQKTYGLTRKQHEAMHAAQDGRCGLCRQPLPYDQAQTDHDHETGKVRGLLCRKCNTGMSVIEKYRVPVSRITEWLERGKD